MGNDEHYLLVRECPLSTILLSLRGAGMAVNN